MQMAICDDEQGFVLKSRKGIVRISFTGLEFVEVINKTVFFHLADGATYEVTAALADFEEKLLDRPEFFKTHRSYLVNLNYIRSIGINCVVTKNGHDIPVSRQRRNEVQDAYIHFLYKTETGSLRDNEWADVYSKRQERAEGSRRILLVDDDTAERAYWSDILQIQGCIVQMAKNGREALRLVKEEAYDCVLLDVMIPGEDGFSICERLKEFTDAPVIFLSCITEADRQLEGFAAGGIDYITKDTPPELFWAKVETRIRFSMAGRIRTQVCYGPLFLDLARHHALMDGKELLLTSDEFDILWRLSEHEGQVFTPEEIGSLLYGRERSDGGETVQIHMSRLRRKLDKAWGEHHFIETVWGQGYRFAAPEL